MRLIIFVGRQFLDVELNKLIFALVCVKEKAYTSSPAFIAVLYTNVLSF